MDLHALDPERLSRRLRVLGQDLEPSPPDDREIRHLIRVLTEGSLLLTDVYNEERIARIMSPEGGFLDQLVDRMMADHKEGEGEVLYRVRRLPDDVRVVGDKALFDLGLSDRRKVAGYDLNDLGKRAYLAAGELLQRLAEDRKLRKFFKDNRLLMLPLEEEVVFLQQCADRFQQHAHLLRRLGEPETADMVEPSLTETAYQVQKAKKGVQTADADVEPKDPYLAAAMQSEPEAVMTREQLLSAYERMVRFASLDHEKLRHALSEVVVDQDLAIQAMCDDFSLFAAGTKDLKKPSSYFLVGPTGVGKNHLVETLVRTLEGLWDCEIPVLTLEGPNYTYPSDIHELRGATRGFIRSDEEGLLTAFHQKSATAPLAVILVDEVEKAHPQLQRFFLSILDRGSVTDNRGDVLGFANTLIFFTSNLGYSDRQQESATIGYGDEAAKNESMNRDIRRALKKTLAPEFVNRVQMVHFGRLGRASAKQILALEFQKLVRRYEALHGVQLELTERAEEALLDRGFSAAYGARHLKKALESVANVEVSKRLREDDHRDESDRDALVQWLREIQDGHRPFDRDEARKRVIEATKAQTGYSRLIIDFDGEKFIYQALDEPEATA